MVVHLFAWNRPMFAGFVADPQSERRGSDGFS
jgi:hypothetical protein